jgi:hypothetical protein
LCDLGNHGRINLARSVFQYHERVGYGSGWIANGNPYSFFAWIDGKNTHFLL